jgi:phosphate:Na+ symporter
MTGDQIFQLIGSLIWLLAGVGVFIVGMNFLSGALEKSAGNGMKRLLGKISNNRFSGVGIGAGVTAIVQSSSATSVMVIGLVNAGVMTLMQATPIIMGANIGTTITGVLVALKNDYFDMLMYLLAFAGVMMGFAKNQKIKLAGSLCGGLGLIFVGLSIMSSQQAFGNDLVKQMFTGIFSAIDFPLLLILVGAIFTALMQSSSAATGIVITMVGNGVLDLSLALFIVLGANIGTCVTALLASTGANANSKRVAFIHFTFNVIGSALFATIIWIFKDSVVSLLVRCFPAEDTMSLQMRVSLFHVIFNVTTTCLLLPFVKQLVQLSQAVIKDKKAADNQLALKYVDDLILATPPIALMQVKKEMQYMLDLVEENVGLAFGSLQSYSAESGKKLRENEQIINFTNGALTKFLIKLAPSVDHSDEKVVGSYFHVLNDLERLGDHAKNLQEICEEMNTKNMAFSQPSQAEICTMRAVIVEMLQIAKDAFVNLNKGNLPQLDKLEDNADALKKQLTANHFLRLAEGGCDVEVSPYYSSTVTSLERIADLLVNVGYSIVNPVGEQTKN